MYIHNIKITNFRSAYGEHYFDFDNIQGLIKLSGPIGSGKTTLGEAILCGLYGRVKDHPNPNMVAWGTDTWEIELNMFSKGREIHLIRNPKKQLEVTVDGKAIVATGKKDMQTILEEFYDVPKMAIERMCVISFNAFNSLAAMSPYDTKTFLDDVFGFKTFTNYNEQVILERKDKIQQSSELNAVLKDTQSQIQYLRNKQQRQQDELANQVDITGLDEKRNQLIEDGKKEREVLNNILNKIKDTQNERQNKISEITAKKSEMATLGRIEKEKYNTFKNGSCPTCGNKIDTEQIDTYKSNVDKYAAEWRKYNDEEIRVGKEYDEVLSGFNAERNESEQKISKLKSDINDIDKKIEIYNNNLKLIEENYTDLIAEYINKEKQLIDDINSCDIEIGEWNELNDLFTKTLRYKLLDTLIPHINNSIQYYINKLELRYRLFFDQEFKAHIFADNIEGEIAYKDLSTGQRKTLDIAIIFGILQNIITNVNFNIFFLDELMSNMDTDTRNVLLSVLSETLSKDRTVFVINHAEMNDDFFNHKIRVSLQNKKVKLSRKKLKKAIDTGSDEIVAKASNYELVF